MTEPQVHPLVPEDCKPRACRELGCRLMVYPDPEDADAYVWAHGADDRYPISAAKLDDVDYDLWSELKQWMTGLHDG